MQPQFCKFFLKGECNKGNNCPFIHQIPQGMQIQNPHQFKKKENKDNTCKFFLQGNCTKANCNFFHGYGNKLLSLTSFKNAHNLPIICFSQINEDKFISCDETSFKIWGFKPEFKSLQEEKINEGKISKLIYSNGKIFIINIISKMYVN